MHILSVPNVLSFSFSLLFFQVVSTCLLQFISSWPRNQFALAFACSGMLVCLLHNPPLTHVMTSSCWILYQVYAWKLIALHHLYCTLLHLLAYTFSFSLHSRFRPGSFINTFSRSLTVHIKCTSHLSEGARSNNSLAH